MLQAYHLEAVITRVVDQSLRRLERDDPDLDLPAGQPCLEREIQLIGERTGVAHLRARSRLALDRLPEEVRAAIDARSKPIGQILEEACLETRREILRCGHDAGIVWRTYRIVAGGRPLMRITERFLDG